MQCNLVIINWVGAKSVSLTKLYRVHCLFNVFTREKNASLTKSSFRRSISLEILHGDSSGIKYEFVMSVIVGFAGVIIG